MSRTIKFRAWFDGRMVLGMTPGDDYGDAWEDGELQQFTGVLDKSGKEIYEGDIVQFDMPLAGKPQIRQIIYSAKRAAFVVDSGDYFPKEDWNVEVIGNIYQNPELAGAKCAT